MIAWEKLKAPFPADQIEWRIGRSGEKNGKVWATCLAYLNNRAIMDRLDNVAGPANWKNEYVPGPTGGVLCGISIRVLRDYGDPQTEATTYEWVCKWDGAENTDIEAVKGGISDSMKRAAVQWGIGRYLYHLDEGFAEISENGKFRAQTKDKKPFRWNPPQLPAWALPAKPKPVAPVQPQQRSAPTVRQTQAGPTSEPERDEAAESKHTRILGELNFRRRQLPKGHAVRTEVQEWWKDAREDMTLAQQLLDKVDAALAPEVPAEVQGEPLSTRERLNRAYHAQMVGRMKELGWTDDTRHDWQEQAVGKRSSRDWTEDDYRTALRKLEADVPQGVVA
jgi:hypothetical protein